MRFTDVCRAIVDRAQRHGKVITRAEALALGAHTRDLTRLVSQGVLLRPHPGVYVLAGANGDPYLAIRAAIAAVAAGTHSRNGLPTITVASHDTAAWLQGLLERQPAVIHLTVAARWGRRLGGVVLHRTSEPLRPVPYKGIRCTPPVRTLIDLAAEAPPHVIERAVDRALAGRLVRMRDIERGLEREGAGRRGAGYLHIRLLERGYVGGPTPSLLESDMGRLLRRTGLPVPKAEVHAGPDGRYRIDFVYSARRVAVELYGYTWHHSPAQMTADMARQRKLTLEGWTVLVYTWQDVHQDPERVAEEIAAALGLEVEVAS